MRPSVSAQHWRRRPVTGSSQSNLPFMQVSGGRGIRTHEDGVAALAVFKTAAIGH